MKTRTHFTFRASIMDARRLKPLADGAEGSDCDLVIFDASDVFDKRWPNPYHLAAGRASD